MSWVRCFHISGSRLIRRVSISAQVSKQRGRNFDGPNAELDTRGWNETRSLLDKQGRFAVEGQPTLVQVEAEDRIRACKARKDWVGALQELSCVEVPNHALYATALDVCVEAAQEREAETLWVQMPVSAHGPSRVSVYNMMLKMYRRSKRLDKVKQLFSDLLKEGHEPSIITYSEVIQAYGLDGMWEDAIQTLDTLRSGRQWSMATQRQKQIAFVAAMIACARKGVYMEARKVFDTMQQEGVAAQHNHFNALLTACTPSLDADTAVKVVSEMHASGLQLRGEDYAIWMACSRNNYAACENIFAKMSAEAVKPSRLALEALAESALYAGKHQRAKDLLDEASRSCTMTPTRKSRKLEAEAQQALATEGAQAPIQDVNGMGKAHLPPGWVASTCPTSGAQYYWHQSDPHGTVTWADPRSLDGRR